jgi:glutathione synthase/RimK-type ligase-like ATP-grasp enzyme
VHVALVRSREPAAAGHADDLLAARLADRGVEVARPCWDDPGVDWARFDVAVVRTTWDYVDRREEFLDWAEATARLVALHNPPHVLRWNTHKGYLLELEERGAPVVPTAWLGRGDHVDVHEVLRARGWAQAVAKPAVGVGGRGLVRLAAGAPDQGADELRALVAAGDVLVQPYLDAVEKQGELSVVVVDGEVTHAVRKVPAAGEYRVHAERGATHELVEADAEVAALARWVVEATGLDLLVARVDLLPDAVGAWQLVELEVTEPHLYLALAPDTADRLADAILRRARTLQPTHEVS